MKRLFILSLLTLLAMIVPAQETQYNSNPDLTHIRIKDDPGETLDYIGKIGSDFDTALDSLRKLKAIRSEIIKAPLEVIFDDDDRLFFGISYGDCGMYSDVLDTKGYYYLRTWYSSGENYRPFIETGKVWRTGINPGNGFLKRYEYRLYGDTIIDGKTCRVLGRSELKFNAYSYTPKDTLYAGALYEEGGMVYGAKPGESHLILLYDFESPVGTDLEINGTTFTITGREKSKDNAFKGVCTYIQIQGGTEETVPYWMEGVGGFTSPMESVLGFYPTGLMNEILISCSLGDEAIYLRDEGIPSEFDVKKQWLDFTHTTKPRPKAPGRNNSQLYPEQVSEPKRARRLSEANDTEGENISGEYSDTKLFVNLKPLLGSYIITMQDEAGQDVYHKEVRTSNVVALNTDLSNYAEGTYTLTVENSEEQYTASLTLPLPLDDHTPVRDLQDKQMVNGKMVNCFDLTGRRLTTPPTKGIYIENGQIRVAQ